jgi:integrase
MGIYKRGEIWWMRFTYNGKQIRRSTETADKKLAQRIFDKIKGEVAEGKWFERLPGEDYTFGEVIEKYLAEYSALNKAPKSHKRDKSLAKHLLDHFRDFPVLEISSKDIVEYKTKRRGEDASPRTINYELALMSHAFNIALREWEWVKENPVKKVSKERVHNQIERWLTLDEEKRLLAAAPKWLKEIIIFAIHTGFRESEILDLKWLQIDLTRRTVTISEQKNRGIDTLPLGETVMRILREKARDHYKRDDLVFPSANQTRLLNRNVFRAFSSATKKARIEDLRFHDMRHTFATRLVQSGVDLYTVQKLGRWKTTAMIMRYAHHHSESLRPGIEVMDRIQSGFSTNLAQSQKIRGHKPALRLVTP